MADHTSNWTDERVEAVKRLWKDGVPASEIASRVGGMTRNAVIGKVTRLGLPGRRVTVRKPYDRYNIEDSRAERRTYAPSRVQPKVARSWRSEPLPETPVTVARVSFLDLENHHCRWPIGDPKEIKPHEPQFCGCTPVAGLPYCSTHAHRAYVPIIAKKHDTYRAPSPVMKAAGRHRVYA